MLEHFDLGLKPPAEVSQHYYFVYSGYSVLGKISENLWTPLLEQEWQDLPLSAISVHYIGFASTGILHDAACHAVELQAGVDAPSGYEWLNLRHFIHYPDESLFALAGRGMQIIEWHLTHQFCGRCGDPLQTHQTDRARICESCRRTFYPRLSPCIIVLVTRGEELLLARGVRHPEGMYSTLAGFIEPGETVEQAVHREVKEEVGINVRRLQYWGSQPWPFPHQLMLGFYAEYKSGDLVLEEEEIEEAQWWHYKDLPNIPPDSTISGKLIRDYLAQLEA